MAKNSDRKLNVPMLLISAVVAALAWIGIFSLKEFIADLGNLLVIGIISTAFLLVLSLVVFFVSKLLGTYQADVVTGERNKSMFFVTLLICTLIFFGLACGFEWLYEVEVLGGIGTADTYIFVVDDSGSTLDSDPDQMRFEALQSMMEEKDGKTQYAIYTFADGVDLLQPMQLVSDGIPEVKGKSEGGTSIKAALERVINDYENEEWEAKGGIQVILITDGYPTDIASASEVDSILERYSENGIPVSCVGLGYVDETLMSRIADKTDGEFIDIEEVDEMGDAVESAVQLSSVEQDLYSDRPDSSYNLLRGIMRILFVGILGAIISLTEAFAYGNSSTFWFITIAGTIKAFVASAILELGICVADLPAWPVCLISMTIIGTVLARFGNNSDSRGLGKKNGRRIDFDD